MANKVIIGIVGKHYNSEKQRTDTYIRDEVKQAIFDNGAIAIGILASNEELIYCRDNWNEFGDILRKDDIINQINLCDGIILQGGTTNEVFEFFIAKYCYDNDIPCLGICAGQNCIVDALGGTIKHVEKPECHNRKKEIYAHDIQIIDKDSKFYSTVQIDSMQVNSRHKNVVDKHPLLDVVALDCDGNIEVVESKGKKFYMGVRYHPESLYKIDQKHNAIFQSFIDSCKNRKREYHGSL